MDNLHGNVSSGHKTGSTLTPVSDIIDRWPERFLRVERKGNDPGIPSGFPEIDGITNCFETPCLTTIIGRPGMGKTSFALDLALNIGLNSSKPAVIFSYELSKEQILRRFLAKLALVDYHDLMEGKLSYPEWKRVSAAESVLRKSNIYIDDTPGHTAEEIKEICLQIDNPGIVCVDYLQLISPQTAASGQPSEVQHYTKIANVLKNIAEQVSAPVVCLSQISREVESRENKRPLLSDVPPGIREVSDVIIALYRDHYYNHESPDNFAEAIVLKNSFGATGTAELLWRPGCAAFHSTAQRTGEYL